MAYGFEFYDDKGNLMFKPGLDRVSLLHRSIMRRNPYGSIVAKGLDRFSLSTLLIMVGVEYSDSGTSPPRWEGTIMHFKGYNFDMGLSKDPSYFSRNLTISGNTFNWGIATNNVLYGNPVVTHITLLGLI